MFASLSDPTGNNILRNRLCFSQIIAWAGRSQQAAVDFNSDHLIDGADLFCSGDKSHLPSRRETHASMVPLPEDPWPVQDTLGGLPPPGGRQDEPANPEEPLGAVTKGGNGWKGGTAPLHATGATGLGHLLGVVTRTSEGQRGGCGQLRSWTDVL